MLTGLSLFWFERTSDLVAQPPRSTRTRAFPPAVRRRATLAGRAMLVRRAEVVPVECVARGYLSGSGWKEYAGERRGVRVRAPRAGSSSPIGCPEPIFTPTTKAAAGHDLPLTLEETADLVGRDSPSG